jgi:hypothetical protein
MNEAETRAELIDPALKAAGWGVIEGSRIRREVIAPGRLIGNGKRAQSDIADYVLVYRGADVHGRNRPESKNSGVLCQPNPCPRSAGFNQPNED